MPLRRRAHQQFARSWRPGRAARPAKWSRRSGHRENVRHAVAPIRRRSWTTLRAASSCAEHESEHRQCVGQPDDDLLQMVVRGPVAHDLRRQIIARCRFEGRGSKGREVGVPTMKAEQSTVRPFPTVAETVVEHVAPLVIVAVERHERIVTSPATTPAVIWNPRRRWSDATTRVRCAKRVHVRVAIARPPYVLV